jgi:hypothetical protein
MEWHKVTLTHEDVVKWEHMRLGEAFRQLNDAAGRPRDSALFTEMTGRFYYAYFSPASIPHCADLIAHYSGFPCDKPERSQNIALKSGYADAWRLLD